jgi:hypothetical protein
MERLFEANAVGRNKTNGPAVICKHLRKHSTGRPCKLISANIHLPFCLSTNEPKPRPFHSLKKLYTWEPQIKFHSNGDGPWKKFPLCQSLLCIYVRRLRPITQGASAWRHSPYWKNAAARRFCWCFYVYCSTPRAGAEFMFCENDKSCFFSAVLPPMLERTREPVRERERLYIFDAEHTPAAAFNGWPERAQRNFLYQKSLLPTYKKHLISKCLLRPQPGHWDYRLYK